MLPARSKNFYQMLADILPIRGSTSAQRHFRKQLLSTANKHIYVLQRLDYGGSPLQTPYPGHHGPVGDGTDQMEHIRYIRCEKF